MGSGKRVNIIFYGGGPFGMRRLSTMLSYIRKSGLEILNDDKEYLDETKNEQNSMKAGRHDGRANVITPLRFHMFQYFSHWDSRSSSS